MSKIDETRLDHFSAIMTPEHMRAALIEYVRSCCVSNDYDDDELERAANAAVDDILALLDGTDPRHVVTVNWGDLTYSARHPLHERIGGALHHCDVGTMVRSLFDHDAKDGVPYHVWRSDAGVVHWEKVDH